MFESLSRRRHEEQLRLKTSALWDLVQNDGCVMMNPLRVNEGTGWVVFVQYDNRDQEFRGRWLSAVLDEALEVVRTW